MSKQSRLTSLFEASFNTFLGFLTSFVIWPVVAALHDLPYSVGSSMTIVGIFTVASVVRGYVVRRFFANGMHRLALDLAKRVSQ